MADTQPAMTYPAEEQYQRWKDHAEELDMSVSEFMQAMIEAGRRKFDRDVSPDETVQELREQRSVLKEELERKEERIDRLESRLQSSERQEIRDFLKDNPGASFAEVVEHVANSVESRVRKHLETMEGVSVEGDRGREYTYIPKQTPLDELEGSE